MIILEAGHSKKRPGASAKHGEYTYHEYQIAINQRNCIRELINKKRPDIKVLCDDDNETMLSKVIAKFKKAASESKEVDVIMSFHTNAATPQATGIEIFVPERSTDFEREYASKMSKHFSSIMKIRNRGVKPESASQHKSLGIMQPDGANFLVEWFFITNETDTMCYIHNEDRLMEVTSDYLIEMHDKLNS